MSRNRCSTDCACGFPGLDHMRELPLGDERLKTEEELGVANRYSPHGWGFHDHLNGARFGASRGFHEMRYALIPPERRYRFAFVDCALCRRHYIGWYVHQPYTIDEHGEPLYTEEDGHGLYPHWELYDTSFRASFNDEPAAEDLAHVRPVDLDLIAKLLDEHEHKSTP